MKRRAHGLSRDALVADLDTVLETELEPAGTDAGAESELPFSGTADELLDHLELRRSDDPKRANDQGPVAAVACAAAREAGPAKETDEI